MRESVIMRFVKGACGVAFCCAFIVNCAAAFGQTDNFPDKLKLGCDTEVQCKRLVTEAEARKAKCQPNTIGYLRCADAEADLQIATGYLNEKVTLREQGAREKEDAERLAQQKQRDEERAQERLSRLKAVEAAEAAQARREEERATQAETLWTSIDPKKCSEHGDAQSCAALEEYARSFSSAPHAPEARIALRVGREFQAQQEERREAASEVASSPSKAPASKRKQAKCCNGTIDGSCGCEGGAGCCFQRGGVCGCQ